MSSSQGASTSTTTSSSGGVLSEEQLDAAALNLAIESRELLGIPLGPLPSSHVSSTSGPIPWEPETLPSPPTALEFLRLVSRSSPVIIRGCLDDRTEKLQRWKDTGYLVGRMGERRVKVALDPNGRADDLVWHDKEAREVFALPLERECTFKELVASLTRPDPEEAIAYLQSQNNNLFSSSSSTYGDLSPLLADLCRPSKGVGGDETPRTDLFWATEALGSEPQATNLWLGGSGSRSSMHRDHYENLFHVVRGRKSFTLHPPTEAWFLCDDDEYPVYQYTLPPSSTSSSSSSSHPGVTKASLLLSPLSPPSKTPWIAIDPTEPSTSSRNSRHPRYARGLRALRVDVEEGETLFLPAGWYHHVSQTSDSRPYPPPSASSLAPCKAEGDVEVTAPQAQGQAQAQGLCVCINWWYDSEAAFGDRWALQGFVREVGRRVRGVWKEDDDRQG